MRFVPLPLDRKPATEQELRRLHDHWGSEPESFTPIAGMGHEFLRPSGRKLPVGPKPAGANRDSSVRVSAAAVVLVPVNWHQRVDRGGF